MISYYITRIDMLLPKLKDQAERLEIEEMYNAAFMHKDDDKFRRRLMHVYNVLNQAIDEGV